MAEANGFPEQSFTVFQHQKLLKEDDELIRDKFMEIFASHHGEKMVQIVGDLYNSGVEWENTAEDSHMQAMLQQVASLDPKELILVRCTLCAAYFK